MKINQSRRRPSRKPHSSNQTQDSQGPDGKIRGTASQIFDKYMALARDAASSGDRVSAESFYQYADHYYRIMNPDNENGPHRNDGGRPSHSHGGSYSPSENGPFDDLPSGSDNIAPDGRPPKSDREQRFDTRKSRHPYVSGSNRHHNNDRSQNRAPRQDSKSSSSEMDLVKPKDTREEKTEEVIMVIQ